MLLCIYIVVKCNVTYPSNLSFVQRSSTISRTSTSPSVRLFFFFGIFVSAFLNAVANWNERLCNITQYIDFHRIIIKCYIISFSFLTKSINSKEDSHYAQQSDKLRICIWLGSDAISAPLLSATVEKNSWVVPHPS